MSMDIEKDLKNFKEGNTSQKTYFIASGIGAAAGGFIGGYPGAMMGLSLAGYLFKPDPAPGKEYTNTDDNKTFRTPLDPVPDVIGTDMLNAKCIYINKSTLGSYNPKQLPDMGDSVNEPAWIDFMGMLKTANIGLWAEFAVNFAGRYVGIDYHIGRVEFNKKPVWFWMTLSDMFENYDNPIETFDAMTMWDASQHVWMQSYDIESSINMPVKFNTIAMFKGFFADFSAFDTDPQSSTFTFEVQDMAEMNPGDFPFGPLNTFPVITAEINRNYVRMAPESMFGGHGLVQSVVLSKPTSPFIYAVNCDVIFNNKQGYNRWYIGLDRYTVYPTPVYYEGMEQFPRYPSNDGGIEYDNFPAWAASNLTYGGTFISAQDIFDNRTYVLSYRNWWNPLDNLGDWSYEKVMHHHAEYGIKFDIYWHDNTSETQHVKSLILDYELNLVDGDCNPRLIFYSMEVDDQYIYIFGAVNQYETVVSDFRQITDGANSYTRCYADFSQYPDGYWEDYYVALEQDGFLKYCKITEQTSTYIVVNDEQGGITGGFGKIPLKDYVIKLQKYPLNDCGFAYVGEGSTASLIICNPPEPTDLCDPLSTLWEKCGFYNEQVYCSYSGTGDTTVSLSTPLSRTPVPGEIIYFTQPDTDWDQDQVDPYLTEYDEFLQDLEIEYPKRASHFSGGTSYSHTFIIRLDKFTGGSLTLWKKDRVYVSTSYWWSQSMVYHICSTDKQIAVYNDQLCPYSTYAAHSYLIDIDTKSIIEEVEPITNQFINSHTPTWCYRGTVSVKEWNGSQYIDMWYTILEVFDNNSEENGAAVWGIYFLKLTQGKFSNKRVLSDSLYNYYGVDLGRKGIQKIAYRPGVATGPLYQSNIPSTNKSSDNIFIIGKFTLTEEIYFYVDRWSGLFGPAGHNEFWKYIPPNESNPGGQLYMLNKDSVDFNDEHSFRMLACSVYGNFQQSVYGFFGNQHGRWYQCDECPPTIIEAFWQAYNAPRYFPEEMYNQLDVDEAEGVCNELVPATIYRAQGNIDIIEPRFQFSQSYDQAKKIEDVINEVLATCQGFISPCIWDIRYAGWEQYYKVIVPNQDETPVHYFGYEKANFVSNQTSTGEYLYADFSAYPDNYWKGDEVDFGEVRDFAYPYNEGRFDVIIEQTSTYIKLGIYVSGGFGSGYPFTLLKDNIKEGSFSFSEKSHIEKPNKVRIEFENRLAGYIKDFAEAEDTYRLDVLGEVEKIVTFKMTGIKRATQAGRMALRILDQMNYQLYSCSFETDILGMSLCMGEIIAISHELTGWEKKWFRIVMMEELMDYEVRFDLEEFNPYCYHDAGVPVMSSYPRSGFPSPYIPNNVERFTVRENIETGELHFLFSPPSNDAGFFVGARIYQLVGSSYQYFGIVNQTVSSVQLIEDVGENDTIIYYDPETISGTFPEQGILWIENELIYYHGIDSTNYAFTNVVRGYKDTDIVEHLVENEVYLYLRSDSTLSYPITDSSLIDSAITFKAAAFTIQGLTSDLGSSVSATINFVGYGLLPYFPESIQNKLPQIEYLNEFLGLGDSKTVTETSTFIDETLGLGDDIEDLEE